MDGTATGVVLGGLIGLLLAGAFGLLIGVLAKVLMPGPDPGGWFATILLGIAGSWIGGFAAAALGITTAIPSLIFAILGAMLLLLIYRVLKRA
jgi:uncharacterized membrane protein YeaQ/YmgE (transglycosylase-associated protein family)